MLVGASELRAGWRFENRPVRYDGDMYRFHRISLVFIGVFAVLVAAGCSTGVRGSGTFTRDTRTVGNFDRLVVAGAADVVASIGPQASVTVGGDDNLLRYVTTKVSGGKLVVDTTKDVRPRKKLVVRIVAPALNSIVVSDWGDVNVTGLNADKLSVTTSGEGDVTVSGVAGKLKAIVDGEGDLDTSGLIAKDVVVRVGDEGDASVYASASLDAQADGDGDIEYSGSPSKVNKSSDGEGDILKAG